jgi:hypothetical protein
MDSRIIVVNHILDQYPILVNQIMDPILVVKA